MAPKVNIFKFIFLTRQIVCGGKCCSRNKRPVGGGMSCTAEMFGVDRRNGLNKPMRRTRVKANRKC